MVSHVEKLRVRWVDTDAGGRIHYTAAFRYFEAAEWELFRHVGLPLRSHEQEFGFPRVEVKATFHAPLYVDDEIAVHIRPERIGNSSITFALEVFKEDTRCISGTVTSVFIGPDGRSIPVPQRIRKALTTE
jgi:YbgC/YbaW family acyl-CoA thioester hydrolase